MLVTRLLLVFLLLFAFGCSDHEKEGKSKQKTGSIFFKNQYKIDKDKDAAKLIEEREKKFKNLEGAPLVESLLKEGLVRYQAAKAAHDEEAQIVECAAFELIMEKYKETKGDGITKVTDDIANKTGLSAQSARTSWSIQKIYKFLNFVLELYVERGSIPEAGTFSTESIGKDAWGSDIRIYKPGEYKTIAGQAKIRFMIISAGADGVYDNLDDQRLPFMEKMQLPKSEKQLQQTKSEMKRITVDKLKNVKSRDTQQRKKAQSLNDLMQEDSGGEAGAERKQSQGKSKSLDDLMQ